MAKRKIGIATGFFQRKYGEEEAVRIAASVGADAIDFDTCHPNFYDYQKDGCIFSKSDDEIIEHYTKVKAVADSLGIEISQTHGRIEGFTDDEAWNDKMVKNARLDCLVASTLGAPVCVMHSVTTCRMGPDCDPKLMHSLNFDMFNKYLEFARQYNIQIATETFGDAPSKGCCDFFGNTDEFLKSYNKIACHGDNEKNFVMCVDTGHCNKATRFNNNPVPAEVIRMLGNKIKVLHLNDNDTFTDQHKPLFTGTINWNDVFDALDEIGYNGVYNMELALSCFVNGFEKETAEFSVKSLRQYFKNRYGE